MIPNVFSDGSLEHPEWPQAAHGGGGLWIEGPLAESIRHAQGDLYDFCYSSLDHESHWAPLRCPE
eukprot:9264961-Alexandrium_andersonii.AAC.1